jgi:hypothetical protein
VCGAGDGTQASPMLSKGPSSEPHPHLSDLWKLLIPKISFPLSLHSDAGVIIHLTYEGDEVKGFASCQCPNWESRRS